MASKETKNAAPYLAPRLYRRDGTERIFETLVFSNCPQIIIGPNGPEAILLPLPPVLGVSDHAREIRDQIVKDSLVDSLKTL